jgi:Zn-finger nucleic acid-binding protein
MECVVCKAALEQSQREGVTIDSCPAGHGIWLDTGELRTVVDREIEARSTAERDIAVAAGVTASAPDVDEHDVRVCPACSQPLEKVNYDETSGVMIDTCVEHGVWLDTGEIERVEAWIEGNREELAPIREKLDAELAENDAEIEAAKAAGENWGPLAGLRSAVHYFHRSAGTIDRRGE